MQHWCRRRVQVLNERRPVGLAAVDCAGTETSLLDCSSDDNGLSLCGSDRGNTTDATVLACGNSAPGAHAPSTATRRIPQRWALLDHCFCKLALENDHFPMRSGPSVHWQHCSCIRPPHFEGIHTGTVSSGQLYQNCLHQTYFDLVALISIIPDASVNRHSV